VGRLTTHVLDTAQSCPANNVNIALYRIELQQTGNDRQLLKQDKTNQDGRLDAPILNGDAFFPGVYELVFQADDYFRTGIRSGQLALNEPLFVDEVVLRFGISHPGQHYHVPQLVSPWSYPPIEAVNYAPSRTSLKMHISHDSRRLKVTTFDGTLI
jgi:5-hydroxyisourate hydrolase